MMRDDRGGTALEFGLLMPVLALVLGGLIEYGRIIAARQAMRDIIDGAARAGVVQILSSTAVQEIVETGLVAMPIVRDFSVVVEDGVSLAITVTASYDIVFSDFLPDEMITFQMTSSLLR